MGNDVRNVVTIRASTITDLVAILGEFKDYKVDSMGTRGAVIRFHSKWVPEINKLEEIISNYPGSWVKNEWLVEDGEAGVWVGQLGMIKSLTWDDVSLEEWVYGFQKTSNA
jgi:hypothetical protein